MSYDLFGAVRVDREHVSRIEQIAWAAAREASRCGLFILAGSNVTQQPLRDVLRDRNLDVAGCIPFLVTPSPISDTSHDLLSPLQAGNEDISYLRPGFERVAGWARAVLGIPHVSALDLLTTEGYDTAYVELWLSPDEFAEELLRRVRKQYDVPSLHFHVALA